MYDNFFKTKVAMKENVDTEALMEAAQDALRALDRERDEMRERLEVMDGYSRTLEAVEEMLAENGRLTATVSSQEETISSQEETIERLRSQLQEEREQRAELEMKLMEMNKLSTGMAKKASEDNLLKALRTYVNRSKRKTADKRAFAKSATLEIANANGLDLPEDLKAAIDSLDDELSEPKVVTVTGSYNDIHDNGSVGLSEMGV